MVGKLKKLADTTFGTLRSVTYKVTFFLRGTLGELAKL